MLEGADVDTSDVHDKKTCKLFGRQVHLKVHFIWFPPKSCRNDAMLLRANSTHLDQENGVLNLPWQDNSDAPRLMRGLIRAKMSHKEVE